ncbi:tripartite tricarboxylate transporter substrate binding protein [Xenophilus sp. Marseille-Q4582]|uniref:tripartite tricarboxylate transporter substrate binding protein n=1 Tax=Xenophilus sp. Marseille-Q4582 TaxID=2866600 RepID=UPI001CE4AB48|nr:tripartite tricarboxylate transporter substrate binding protein [Xenophilus sp. Marseille-Q4582]
MKALRTGRRGALRRGLAAAAGLALPAVHAEGAWPQRALRLIVVYPPGGMSDRLARALAQPLHAVLGQPVIVHNHAGAGGTLGLRLLARAAPDGHTLAFSAITPLTLQPLLGTPGSAQLREGVVPLAGVVRAPVLVVGTPAFEGRDFEALIAQARARPGRLRWASSGIGTSGHLVLAQVRRHTGTQIVHVPYEGGGRQLGDALSGQFEVLSTNLAAPQVLQVQRGALRALAVGAADRVAELPGAPTLAELGLPEANIESLFGLFAPAGTATHLRAALGHAVRQALGSAAFQAQVADAMHLRYAGSVADFEAAIREEAARHAALFGHDPQFLQR